MIQLMLGCEAFKINQSMQRREMEIHCAKNGNDHQGMQVSCREIGIEIKKYFRGRCLFKKFLFPWE